TIHTNDAVGTISRLLDMGIEPYLVASAVSCIVGQRLIRKLCAACSAPVEADLPLLEGLGIRFQGKAPVFYRGGGCTECKGTGLKGRLGIYEVLLMDEGIRSLILSKASGNAVLEAAKKKGFRTLRYQGIRTALAGHTTVEEVFQSTQMVD
ncbi:partial Type II secretion system protein E, partial [Anaerolineae bacterium]